MPKILNRKSPYGEGNDRIVILDAQWQVVRPVIRKAMLAAGQDPDTLDNAAFEAHTISLLVDAGWDRIRELAAAQAADDETRRAEQVRERRARAAEAALSAVDLARTLREEPPAEPSE